MEKKVSEVRIIHACTVSVQINDTTATPALKLILNKVHKFLCR